MGMTDNELIELLRRMSPRLDILDCENVLTAADRIEQLAAKLDKAVEVLREYAPETIDGVEYSGMDDAGRKARAILDELEK